MVNSPALSLLAMTRPVNMLMAGVAVVLGYHVGRGEVSMLCLALGPLSAMLITVFANLDNDLTDIAVDRINRPVRPLPSGRVSVRMVQIASLAALATALVLSGICGRKALLVAGSIAVWLVIYNQWAKRRLLIGNVMVALAGGLPILYAGVIAAPVPGRWKLLYAGFSLGMAFHLVREILKDIQDIEGDSRSGAATLPVVLGVPASARLAAGTLAVIALLAPIPGIVQWFNGLYLWPVILLISIPSLFGCIRLCRHPGPDETAKWASRLKAMMAVGLVLLWLGAT